MDEEAGKQTPPGPVLRLRGRALEDPFTPTPSAEGLKQAWCPAPSGGSSPSLGGPAVSGLQPPIPESGIQLWDFGLFVTQ